VSARFDAPDLGLGEVIFSFRPEPWMKRAACAGMDYEMFFPERGQSVIAAKTVCAQCAVRAICLDYAMSINERHGIWGGTTEKERRVLRRQRGSTRPRPRRHAGPLGYRYLTPKAEEASND
jgi:WhiB family redox-sensing transcriptional regulator